MASQEVLESLEKLHLEIEKLEPAIKHVESAQQVTKSLKEIPQKIKDLFQHLKTNDANHKEELKNQFSQEINIHINENKRLQKTTSDLQEQIKLENQALSELIDTIKSFHERIEKIKFPDRLDKLDANVAGIMAAIQAVQSRLDGLERNMSDRLRDLMDYQKDTRTTLQNAIEQTRNTLQKEAETTSKKQQYLSLVTLALVVISIVITFLR